jgi:hypothetical protein
MASSPTRWRWWARYADGRSTQSSSATPRRSTISFWVVGLRRNSFAAYRYVFARELSQAAVYFNPR